MDTRTGKLYRTLDEAPADAREHCVEVEPTPRQLQRGRVGRNDYCPCGSGAKFKKCCSRKAAAR